MNILLNAISISEGGALVILRKMLIEMIKLDPSIKWHLVVKPSVANELTDLESVTLLTYPWANRSPLHLFFWYQFTLPKLLEKVKADVCFSQTNFLPSKKLPCKSLLLIHNAGLFSDVFQRLYLNHHRSLSTKFRWKQKRREVINSIQNASKVTVQTTFLAKSIIEQTKINPNNIITIAHGPGLINPSLGHLRTHPGPTVWRIGYITKFGVQKDFQAIFSALSLLKEKGIPVKLILTLNPNYPSALSILNQAQQQGIDDLIENHGEVSDPKSLQSLYESLHLFAFPSLCESFGFTLIEAMSLGLPVIASDTPSNLELMSNAGFFFKASDARNLFENIEALIGDSKLYEKYSNLCLEQSKKYTWPAAAKATLDLLKELRG